MCQQTRQCIALFFLQNNSCDMAQRVTKTKKGKSTAPVWNNEAGRYPGRQGKLKGFIDGVILKLCPKE